MYHLIGIKGSGMASLAHILLDLGEEVTGSDIDNFIFTEKALKERGVEIKSFNENNIQDNTQVIIGNSFFDSHPEVAKALANPTVKTYRYREYLAKLLTDYIGISVVGTHGKTTTTGMLAHILEPIGRGYLIGDGTGAITQANTYFVAESCEYQDNFLLYHPDYAVVLNMELDHVDYFKSEEQYFNSFQQFVNNVKKGIAILGDDKNMRKLATKIPTLYFGFNEKNDVVAKNIQEFEFYTEFDVYYHNELYVHVHLPLVGKHMLYDALGAITTLILLDIDKKIIETQIQSFAGTKRRFNVEKDKLGNVYIDDYAHHPTAVVATIAAARKSYPNKKIVAVFKPDRPSRIEFFKEEFKTSLQTADAAYIVNYNDGTVIAEHESTGKEFADFCKTNYVPNETIETAKILAKEGEAVYVFMSSKDIYKFKDLLKNYMEEQ